MALIYFLSSDHLSFPGARRTWLGFVAAKGVHLTEYAVLTLLWYRVFNDGLGSWNPTAAVLSVLAASLYAGFDELHQSFTIHRRGVLRDVLLDAGGALLAMVGVWAACCRKDSRGGARFGARASSRSTERKPTS
jgi:VanZ family protein